MRRFFGSSPLARGTPTDNKPPPPQLRLIPARAGNTTSHKREDGSFTAHPRSRGEHECEPRPIAALCGSSPLARGTRQAHLEVKRLFRLIPARAGNTHCLRHICPQCAAHPRSRGEHETWGLVFTYSRGSSPLARGTRGRVGCEAYAHRLIPARAGNTWAVRPRAGVLAAHPRSRGEHQHFQRRVDDARGSSPLARGTLFLLEGVAGVCRLIPARAGNTASVFVTG